MICFSAPPPGHSLTVEVREDGTVDVFLEIASTPDLEDWINQRAGTIEAISPLTLRAAVHRILSVGADMNAGMPAAHKRRVMSDEG